jgi:hypothetical protein
MKFKALCQLKGVLRRQVLVKRTRGVRVQVVLHQHNLRRGGKVSRDPLHKAAVIGFGALSTRFHQPRAGQRLKRDLERSRATACIFVVHPRWLVRLHGQRGHDIAQQLDRQLIEPDDWTLDSVRQAVQVQDSFHPREIVARDSANTPLAFLVWLQRVFFRIWRTVVWLMSSTKPSSTTLSASRRKLQRACPVGAAEQANAVILARAVPSMVGGLPERGLSRSAAASPSLR